MLRTRREHTGSAISHSCTRSCYLLVAINPLHYLLGFTLGTAIVGVAVWFFDPLLVGLALVAGTYEEVAG